tara:strand:+ start:4118 stop:4834 length:717 start_codon:yes stop_codon:yes gene_type:complete
VKQLWGRELTNNLNSIAIISDDKDLILALDECFKLHKRFQLLKYDSRAIAIPKNINTNINAILMSDEIYDILQDDEEENKFWQNQNKNLIHLTSKNEKKISSKNSNLKPRYTIKLPLNFNSTLNILDTIVRENSQRMNDIKIGSLILDVKGKKISLNKKVEKLTEKETEILWRLLSNKNSKILQKDLLKDIWGYDEDIETRTLETHIYRIRKKLNLIGVKKIEIKNIENSYILKINDT